MNKNKITVLIVWNAALSVIVFMLMVTLWATQENVKTLAHENAAFLELLDQMVETDKIFAEAVRKNTDSIGTNADSIALVFQFVNDHVEHNITTIAEIYQGHIIPIRAILMNNDLNWP